jgi:dienelactone hydrolase
MKIPTLRLAPAALLAGVFACAPKPAPAPVPAPPPPSAPAAELARDGTATVLDADIVLTDSSRNRDLPVRVVYPQGPGPFPVIVFSHGGGGASRTFDGLARFWASHWFAVLLPSHADAAAAGAPDPATQSAREPAADASADAKVWESRVRDLQFVAAATLAIEGKVPGLRLDESRVGVGGQSLGAFSAMLLAGTTVEVSKKARGFSDSIPKAFLLISPPGKGQQGLTDKSWSAVTRPVMVVTGTRDPGSKNQDPSWRLDAYQLSPPGGKYAVFIEGGSHASFIGLGAEVGSSGGAAAAAGAPAVPSAQDEAAIFQAVRAATAAFWQVYLKSDAAAAAFLRSDALMTESGNRAQLLRR